MKLRPNPGLPGLPERLGVPWTRRALLSRGAGAVATSALIAAIDGKAGAQDQAISPPALVTYTLTASEFEWALMDDVIVKVWGYNGQMPGPELRAREGDTIQVTLENDLPIPTTIHWHGVNVRPAMDGVAGLSQAPVAPGQSFTYEFVAKPAGTRWYHSHTDPAIQVPMGLYGPLIIDPASTAEHFDREYTLMLAEWDLELTPEVATGKATAGPGDRTLRGGQLGADFFLINGRMHGGIPPIGIAKDERILVRLIHAGAIPHPIHTHGHSFTVIATDGNVVPEVARLTKDTILLAPAERYDLAIEGNNPGVWMVHCHIEHHMANGMMTTLWYDGEQPAGPYAAFQDAPHSQSDDSLNPMETPSSRDGMEMGPEAAVSPTATQPMVSGSAFEITMVDDRFDPTSATISSGSTVNWVNEGRNWHSVAAFDGSFESGKIAPGETFSHQFTTSGKYQYLCKHHGMQGMIGVINVNDPS